MAQTVQLLERALQAWEDIFLIYESRIRVGLKLGTRKPEELVGPVRHWRELRNHLLQIKGNDYDLDRFGYRQGGVGFLTGPSSGPAVDLVKEIRDQVYEDPMAEMFDRAFEALPLQLASWTISSRRVFQLSDELAQRFLAADYSRYAWSDLLWPFDAFVVNLDVPLALPEGSVLDMLLVSSLFDVCPEYELSSEDGFECLPFYSQIQGSALVAEFLSERDRDWFRDAIRHKRWVKMNLRLVKIMMESLGGTVEAGMIPLPSGFNTPMAWAKDGPVGDSPEAKIIAGLCLYLEALPAGMAEGYPWKQAEKVTLRKCLQKIVTDGECVCQVEDFNVLSPDTISLFPQILQQGPAFEVSPHWRRAHYRRRPGQGNNPHAPRDVLVKPALIHKDQMPEGVVPGGAITLVR